MHARPLFLLPFACAAIALLQKAPAPVHAQTQTSVALEGQVTSAEEGPMEGVLVSAKRADSTITITVVSDRQGRYRFPLSRLGPGRYGLRIRAVGYDLEGPDSTEIVAGRTVSADLKLRAARDLGLPADERGMACELSWDGRTARLGARLLSLPHLRARHPFPARCKRVRFGHRANVRISAAGLPVDATANPLAADWSRDTVPRAPCGRVAAPG